MTWLLASLGHQQSWINHAGYRESIMGSCVERSSPEWVCIPEITSNSEWFLWNTSSRGWTLFHKGAHDRFYFFHNIFSVITLQKIQESLPNRQKSQSEVGNHNWVWKKSGSLSCTKERISTTCTYNMSVLKKNRKCSCIFIFCKINYKFSMTQVKVVPKKGSCFLDSIWHMRQLTSFCRMPPKIAVTMVDLPFGPM